LSLWTEFLGPQDIFSPEFFFWAEMGAEIEFSTPVSWKDLA
jgi:hypothetical protein